MYVSSMVILFITVRPAFEIAVWCSCRRIFIGTHQFTCIACVGEQKIILTFLFTTNCLFDGTNHAKINAVHLISVHSGPDQPM